MGIWCPSIAYQLAVSKFLVFFFVLFLVDGEQKEASKTDLD